MSEPAKMNSPMTVFICNRGHGGNKKTTPVRVNADAVIFKQFKVKLKENHETTDVAFDRFMREYCEK